MSELFDMSDKVALVTGAGQGVGEAVARRLAEHGAAVVVNDFYGDRADGVAASITEAGGRALGLRADVTNLSEVEAMVETAVARLGGVDVLVNNAGNAGAANAGLGGAPSFWESDPASWEPWIAVNLYGVLNLCRATLPQMVERGAGGRIVTIVSDAGRVGEPGLEIYSGAKAGAAGFMRALARSLGRFQITANCVALATTRTPMTTAWTDNEDMARRVLRNYVIRRFGEPEDAANMVLFLASDAASWITGQTYPVNGGFSLNM